MLPRFLMAVRCVAVLRRVLVLMSVRTGRVRMLNLSLGCRSMRSMRRTGIVLNGDVPAAMPQCHQQSVSGQDRPAEERGKGQTTHNRLRRYRYCDPTFCCVNLGKVNSLKSEYAKNCANKKSGVFTPLAKSVHLPELESGTSSMSRMRSNQLSYRCLGRHWGAVRREHYVSIPRSSSAGAQMRKD